MELIQYQDYFEISNKPINRSSFFAFAITCSSSCFLLRPLRYSSWELDSPSLSVLHHAFIGQRGCCPRVSICGEVLLVALTMPLQWKDTSVNREGQEYFPLDFDKEGVDCTSSVA